MNKIGSTPVPNVQHEAKNLIALLTAISSVSRRMARRLAVLEKRISAREEEGHAGQQS